MKVCTVNIRVPDRRRIIVAATSVPSSWPSLDVRMLEDYSMIRPEWDWIVAGEQLPRSFRAGATLAEAAVISRWR